MQGAKAEDRCADSVVSMPSPIVSSLLTLFTGDSLIAPPPFRPRALRPILLPSADNAVRWMPIGSSVMMSRTSATIAGRVPISHGQRG